MSNLTSRKRKKIDPSLMSLLMNFSLKRRRRLYTEGGVERDKLRFQRVKGQWVMARLALSAELRKACGPGQLLFRKPVFNTV